MLLRTHTQKHTHTFGEILSGADKHTSAEECGSPENAMVVELRLVAAVAAGCQSKPISSGHLPPTGTGLARDQEGFILCDLQALE